MPSKRMLRKVISGGTIKAQFPTQTNTRKKSNVHTQKQDKIDMCVGCGRVTCKGTCDKFKK